MHFSIKRGYWSRKERNTETPKCDPQDRSDSELATSSPFTPMSTPFAKKAFWQNLNQGFSFYCYIRMSADVTREDHVDIM